MHADDPLYLLGEGTQGTPCVVLYRSTDGGHSWQQLLISATCAMGLSPRMFSCLAAPPRCF